jgi:transcriptional regulator with XRE-family HTH domain
MLSIRLIDLRKAKGNTQEEVARYLGVTRPAYTAYETGRRQPDYECLLKLADYFNVSTDYLLGRSDNPNPTNEPDLDRPFKAKTLADALIEVSNMVYEYKLSEETTNELVIRVIDKFNPTKKGGIAAHGPSLPGTGALRNIKENDEENKEDDD